MPARGGAAARAIVAAVCSLAVLLAPACGSEENERQELFADSASVRYEGLSREQIRERAEPMSPARAESLGIIDSTIYIEDLEERLDTVAAEDTLRLPPPADR